MNRAAHAPTRADAGRAPTSVRRALAEEGTPLTAGVRDNMERRFGHDFSRVRVHAGGEAERAAREIDAHAFTVGNDIVFGQGAYAPASVSESHLLAHELAHVVQQDFGAVRRYRSSKAFNFGVANDSVLKEDSFNAATDKKTKPWIESIKVHFSNKDTDADNALYWKGTASATYFSNPVKGADFTFPIAGGSAAYGLTDAGTFTVHRIEGIGYNSGSFSGTPGVDYNPADREGPNKRYSKKDAAGDRSGNMNFAVFYNKGEALHEGPTDASSHGCVHVLWGTKTMKRLNYHSVIGLTKVSVDYP